MEEHVHQDLSEDEGATVDLMAQTTQTPQPTTPPKPSPEAQVNDQFGNTLKYNLASSSLLNYNLSDALPLYPPLSTLDSTKAQPKPAAPTSTPTPPPRSRLTAVKPVEWPSDWHRRAESWQNCTPLDNAFALGCWVVFGLFSLGSTIYNAPPHPPQPQPQQPPPPLPKPALPPAVLPSWHTQFLAKVDGLVRASQELDLRAARALTGIKEVECIGWGLGL